MPENSTYLIIAPSKDYDLTFRGRVIRDPTYRERKSRSDSPSLNTDFLHHWHNLGEPAPIMSPSTFMVTAAVGKTYEEIKQELDQKKEAATIYIIFTSGETTKGLPPEAVRMKRILGKEFPSIPEKYVLTEIQSLNTPENADRTKALLEKAHIVFDRSYLIAPERQLERAEKLFTDAGVKIYETRASEKVLRESGNEYYKQYATQWQQRNRFRIFLDRMKEKFIKFVDPHGTITRSITQRRGKK